MGMSLCIAEGIFMPTREQISDIDVEEYKKQVLLCIAKIDCTYSLYFALVMTYEWAVVYLSRKNGDNIARNTSASKYVQSWDILRNLRNDLSHAMYNSDKIRKGCMIWYQIIH